MALAVLLLVGAVAVAALATLSLMIDRARRQNPETPKPGFASEHTRIVEDVRRDWNDTPGEPALRRFPIRPLGPADRARHLEALRAVEDEFETAPALAMAKADNLLVEIMRARGYPMDQFEAHGDDISLTHPEVVANYRAAHAVAGQGEAASAEDLRRAMVACRVLFNELVGEPARLARATAVASLAAARQARAG